jgi:diguanylate cyclase (GGDEF)-like protein
MHKMSDKKTSKKAKFLSIQKRFIEELPVKLEAIQTLWNGNKDISESGEFYRLVHSLVGSAGTFGFSVLGERARELELFIKQSNTSALSSDSYLVIEQGILALKKIARQGPNNQPFIEDSNNLFRHKNEQQALIYVLEDDVELASEIEHQLVSFGYRVQVFHNASELKAVTVKQVPDVLVSDIHLPEGEDAGAVAAAELRRDTATEIPVIFVSSQDTWKDRLNAVRAGGQSYICKPINFSSLLDELELILKQDEVKPFRILIIDDTVLSEHYASVLESSGMLTEVLNSPNNIFESLTVFRPDLILMDVYMPGCSGIEAAKVIQQNPLYSNLPIVFLSSEAELDKQLEAGGDGFLTKPISDAHLVKAVRHRASRFREMMALMTQDGLTGLLNHINLKLALEREISLAQRRASPLSFVMLDIDNFKAVNDTYGHPIGDTVIKSLARLLSQRLRKGDIASRYGGEEFAVILPDTDINAAFNLLDELREQFSKINFSFEEGSFNVTFSAGISTCPPDKSIENLVAEADRALYKAKHAGKNQIYFITKSE